MPKRTSLTERMQRDERASGVDAFFESPPAATPEKKERVKPAKKAAAKTPRRAAKAEEPGELMGAFFHIRDDQDSLLDRMKFVLRDRDGRKVDRSELVREAIDLLAKHYNIPQKIG